MKGRKFFEKYGNCIIVMLTIIVNVALLGICFDFYYDLNDDVMMKDIMAGVYTGTPDGHNMQTLYILGALISLLYRLCRSFPWYGLFLFLCQMGSLYLVGVRLLHFCRRRLAKAGCLALLSMFLWGIMLPHMIAVQYTVTCTVLASAAIFLFLTTERGLTAKRFIICNVPSVFLVILAYQLRTEMLLLVFPFICLAGLFRWAEEKNFFRKENYIRYGAVLGCILAGMALSRMIDFAAYGSEEWKTFLNFFNKRTEVYDYHYDILTSGKHTEYLSSIGLNDAQQELLANYNFGLDEEIDGEVLGKIADYAAETSLNKTQSAEETAGETQPGGNGTGQFLRKIYQSARLSWYRMLHEEDTPYNKIVLLGYLCVVLTGCCQAFTDKARKKRWSFLWESVLLVFVRTALWVFILMRNRAPVRITHSLYLAEFMVLAGLLRIQILHLGELSVVGTAKWKWKELRNILRPVCVAFLGILCVCYLPHSIRTAGEDMSVREAENRGNLAIAEYCKAHPENFYFEDVYSTVGFSQKMFEKVDNSLANYDIMGGWMCKSPLYREKLAQFGMETMEAGLLLDPSVYFIMDTEEGGTDWLQAYYESKGVFVAIGQVDWIGEGYAVYQVIPINR